MRLSNILYHIKEFYNKITQKELTDYWHLYWADMGKCDVCKTMINDKNTLLCIGTFTCASKDGECNGKNCFQFDRKLNICKNCLNVKVLENDFGIEYKEISYPIQPPEYPVLPTE